MRTTADPSTGSITVDRAPIPAAASPARRGTTRRGRSSPTSSLFLFQLGAELLPVRLGHAFEAAAAERLEEGVEIVLAVIVAEFLARLDTALGHDEDALLADLDLCLLYTSDAADDLT